MPKGIPGVLAASIAIATIAIAACTTTGTAGPPGLNPVGDPASTVWMAGDSISRETAIRIGGVFGIGVDGSGYYAGVTALTQVELARNDYPLPDVILVITGGNDYATGRAVWQVNAGALEFHDYYEGLGIDVRFVTEPIPDTHEFWEMFQDHGDFLVSSFDDTIDCGWAGHPTQSYGQFPVHPTNEGYEAYVACIEEDFEVPPPAPDPCAVGTFSATGVEPCTPAPAGTFVDTAGATEPTECPPGTYQELEGQTECTPAPPGSSVQTAGSTATEPCPPGSFQPLEGQSSCLLAPMGTYVDGVGSLEPTDCPPGTTTESEGSVAASDCVESILVIAYTDIDGSEGYDPTLGDVLIAKIVDMDADGAVSTGDSVTTQQYPLDFAGTSFGSMGLTDHAIISVSSSSSTSVVIEGASSGSFRFQADETQVYAEAVAGTTELLVNDGSNGVMDEISATSLSPSQPDTAVHVLGGDPLADDPFLDVDIFV